MCGGSIRKLCRDGMKIPIFAVHLNTLRYSQNKQKIVDVSLRPQTFEMLTEIKFKNLCHLPFKGVTFPANRFVTVNMFESEKPDSSVLRKSMSEADDWKKEEADVEEVV